ncbi:MAG TPA: AAA family ATPase, partial [candidate division Zixibacteria bacterium]|nr:AAA family ATPase [candidate division Zixibacteria bacterium]
QTSKLKPTLIPTQGGICPDNIEYLTIDKEILQFKSQLPLLGYTDLPVLLTGETGVGKDHMARYFHHAVRPNGPYIAINCASLPETLLESELFGYVRGAFTGADKNKEGLFVAANQGVLFLDEIGDMPLSLQTKLLSVLENRQVVPLGSTKTVNLDIKLIAATNQNLEVMVAQGKFRRDLYYRLSGITFTIPPLRKRKADIPILLEKFMINSGLLKEGEKLEVDFIRQFIAYDWPGNTRELFNKVKRLEIMTMMVTEGDLVELSRSMFKSDVVSEEKSLFDKVEEFERKIIVEALLAANGNKSEVARMLGIHEATVRTKLKRYDISLDNYQMN